MTRPGVTVRPLPSPHIAPRICWSAPFSHHSSSGRVRRCLLDDTVSYRQGGDTGVAGATVCSFLFLLLRLRHSSKATLLGARYLRAVRWASALDRDNHTITDSACLVADRRRRLSRSWTHRERLCAASKARVDRGNDGACARVVDLESGQRRAGQLRITGGTLADESVGRVPPPLGHLQP